MGKSKVTDYMIRYIEENRMDAKSLAAHAGIDAGKLRKDYKEPLDAEEFLSLCSISWYQTGTGTADAVNHYLPPT